MSAKGSVHPVVPAPVAAAGRDAGTLRTVAVEGSALADESANGSFHVLFEAEGAEDDVVDVVIDRAEGARDGRVRLGVGSADAVSGAAPLTPLTPLVERLEGLDGLRRVRSLGISSRSQRGEAENQQARYPTTLASTS